MLSSGEYITSIFKITATVLLSIQTYTYLLTIMQNSSVIVFMLCVYPFTWRYCLTLFFLLLQPCSGWSCDDTLKDEVRSEPATKYMAYLSEFKQLVYPDLPFHAWGKISPTKKPKELPPYILYYNAYGFDGFRTNDLPKEAIEGKPLLNKTVYKNPDEILYSRSFPQGDPISYLIYLPSNKLITGFIVDLYGGAGFGFGDGRSIDHHIEQPLQLGDFHKQFLGRGWGIVKLNLVDVLDPPRSQHDMSEPLFRHLQDSIHTFLTTLGTTPGILHDSLEGLSRKPLFLYGFSFGACTALRYIQEHQGIVKGVIAGGGHFSLKNRFTTWLNLFNKDFSDPVYIINAYDDNRSLFEGVLAFFRNSLDTPRENLIHLHIVPEGCTHSLDKFIQMHSDNATLKGHGLPQSEELLDEVFAGVEAFLNTPQTPMNKLLNRWLLGRWETYYGKDQPIKKFEDDFLSRTMRIFEASPLDSRIQLTKTALGHEDQACFQKLWREQFQQILAYSYMMIVCDRNTIYDPFVHAYIFDQLQQQNESSWANLTSKSMQYVLPARAVPL